MAEAEAAVPKGAHKDEGTYELPWIVGKYCMDESEEPLFRPIGPGKLR
jgi:hypothetical protein